MSERNIRISADDTPAVSEQSVEIVERKGLGHPDSICDGVAESVSRALAQAYLDRVGQVLHYNTDETQLVAGSAAPSFGDGEVMEPIYLLIVGRATKEYEGTKIPAETIALRAARDYISEHIPHLDLGTDIVVDVRFGEGSGDLQHVFGESGSVPMANDTSYGVGFAPLSETEQLVLETERRLNGPYADDNPAIGPDIKVMGKREGDAIDLTVAVALVSPHVESLEAYKAEIEALRDYIQSLASSITDKAVSIDINTADIYEEESVYLTVTGTSAEMGDDGSVGRGNRANGLITPNRPMSLEASSGKNPVNHIGKIYNLLSNEIAASVVEEVEGIKNIRVRLLSQIGRPIDEPHLADAQVVTEDGYDLEALHDDIEAIINRELANVTDITEQIIHGEIRTF